jgi:hypothetical protein
MRFASQDPGCAEECNEEEHILNDFNSPYRRPMQKIAHQHFVTLNKACTHDEKSGDRRDCTDKPIKNGVERMHV